MNIFIFFIHILLISTTVLAALKIGKHALIALISLFAILANLFVSKQITLFGLNATAADAYIVGASLALNLLQEYYGAIEARRAIWTGFFIALIYTLMSQVHLLYQPSQFDSSQAHFYAILHPMPRLIIASLIAYLIAEWCNYRLFTALKKRCTRIPFALRSFAASATSQLIDTILFSFLGLYGILAALGQVMLVSYSIKLTIIIIVTPFLLLAKKIIKNKKS